MRPLSWQLSDLFGEDHSAFAGGTQGIDRTFVINLQCTLRSKQFTTANNGDWGVQKSLLCCLRGR